MKILHYLIDNSLCHGDYTGNILTSWYSRDNINIPTDTVTSHQCTAIMFVIIRLWEWKL